MLITSTAPSPSPKSFDHCPASFCLVVLISPLSCQCFLLLKLIRPIQAHIILQRLASVPSPYPRHRHRLIFHSVLLAELKSSKRGSIDWIWGSSKKATEDWWIWHMSLFRLAPLQLPWNCHFRCHSLIAYKSTESNLIDFSCVQNTAKGFGAGLC